MSKQMVDVILRWRLSMTVIAALCVAMLGPVFMKLYGQLRIMDLSVLVFIVALIPVIQPYMSKLSRGVSLWLPVWGEFAYLVIVIPLLYMDTINYFLVSNFILGPIYGVIWCHRGHLISEMMKSHYNLNTFGNTIARYGAISTFIGSGFALYIVNIITPSYYNIYLNVVLVCMSSRVVFAIKTNKALLGLCSQ